jgi:hypothetical protein
MSIRRTSSSVALALTAALLAACGSTVAQHAAIGGGAAVDNGLGGTGVSGTSPSGGGLVPGGAGSSGSVAGVGPGSTTGGAGAQAPGAIAGPAGAVGPGTSGTAAGGTRGVTDKTVRVGITYSSDVQKYAEVLNPNAKTVDPRDVAKVIVDHVNAQGGVLGRKLEPVYYDQKLADAIANQDAANQAACVAFTEDTPVAWAIVNLANRINYQCMAKGKTVTWDVNTGDPVDQQWAKQYLPYFYAPVMPDSAKYLPAWIDRLAAQQYFTGWDPATQTPSPATPVKVGVYYFDRPTDKRIYEQHLKPALARHGITVAADFAGDPSPAVRANQEQSAILRFRQNNVTHLLVLGPVAFVGAGGQEGWHPRLGVGSHNQAQTADPALLKGVVAAGYSSAIDVPAGTPGAPSPANNTCLSWILKELGYDFTTPGSAAYIQSIALCDAILVPVEAFRAAGAFGAAALQTGLSKTYRKTPTAHTFTQGFTATRWYGAEELRDLVFKQDCKCWRYTAVRTPL